MKEYKIKYSSDIVADLNKLSDFVAKQYTFDSAKLYIARLRKEIEELSVFAEILSDSKYNFPKSYLPKAKTMPIGNRKLTVIFHIDGDFVIVDKILPSSMIKY